MSVSKVTKILVHNEAEVRDIMRRFRNLKRNDKCTDEIVFEGIGVDPGRIAVICGMLLGDIRKIDVRSIKTETKHPSIKTTVTCGFGDALVGDEEDFVKLSEDFPSPWKLRAPRVGDTTSKSVFGFKRRMEKMGWDENDGIHTCASARAIGIFLVFAATVNDTLTHDITVLTAHNTKLDGNVKTVLHMLVQRCYQVDSEEEEEDE